ncbi:MAG: type III-A CRISPR-associated RAMP protein Csm3, partial [Catalinimonas sp.]
MDLLKKKILITGKIVAETGLLIGGTNSAMGIGGPDKTVIRNPVTNEPYVPGSSLKGKMRSLLEIAAGSIKSVRMGNVKHGPDDDPPKKSTQLFGTARTDDDQRPSRIIVRDGHLLNADQLQNTDLPFTEAKTEVVIDRITSAAMPRTVERVPAGAEFALNIVVNVFETDSHRDQMLALTFKGLQMV